MNADRTHTIVWTQSSTTLMDWPTELYPSGLCCEVLRGRFSRYCPWALAETIQDSPRKKICFAHLKIASRSLVVLLLNLINECLFRRWERRCPTRIPQLHLRTLVGFALLLEIAHVVRMLGTELLQSSSSQMFTRIPRIRNPSSNRNEIVPLDIFTVLQDHLAQGGLHSCFMRARLGTSIAHLLFKLRLVVKTSSYSLAVPDRLQVELRQEDANESPLVWHLFAIRASLWRYTR